ncbi:MAG: SDR family NAD(P)-dependent oxidoreductase [Rhodococcus sp. (in: high G+C Gram-positive bacteria)]|nr:MAG: SDR family NAD(P)-dependent oxidoreductase [Rhodococcus sp. (in: high G+C Gram-positive bacteria)]
MQTQQLKDLYGVAGKVVVVTGGSRGIGRAIAQGFVQGGARTYICARDEQACLQAAQEMAVGGECVAIAADLSTIEGCRDLAARLAAKETHVDVLVNNAGTIWTQPLAEYAESGWSKVFDVNVKGTFFLIQSLLKMLKSAASPQDPARVINIGSIGGFRVPDHETYAYSASKAAVHQLSKHLARQLAPDGVTVNVIAPGRYRSEMLEKAIALQGAESLLAPIPLGRFVEDDDLVGAALFLASKAGSAVTGAILPVDCGHGTVG